jgi:hypothetical protein
MKLKIMRVGKWGTIPHSTTHKQLDPKETQCPWVKASIPLQTRREQAPPKHWHIPKKQVQNIYWTTTVIRF